MDPLVVRVLTRSQTIRHGVSTLATLTVIATTLSGCFAPYKDFEGTARTLAKKLGVTAVVPARVGPGACSGGFSVSLTDSGTAYTATKALSVAASLVGDGLFYSDADCTVDGSTLSIAEGKSEVTFYFKTLSGSQTIQATFNVTYEGTAYPATASFEVGAASLSALNIAQSPGSSGYAGLALSTPPVLVLSNSVGGIYASTETASLAAYTDSSCSSAAGGTLSGNSVSAVSGRVSFSNLTYSAAGTIYLKASLEGLSSSCMGPVIFAAVPLSMVLSAPASPSSVAPNACSEYTLTLKDASNATIAASANTTINLAASGGANFYSATGCGDADLITTLTFTANTDSAKTFWVKPLSGPQTLVVRATAVLPGDRLVTASDDYTITAGSSSGGLVFAQAPSSSAYSGIALTTQPKLLLVDSAGTPVTSNNNAVTAALYPTAGDCADETNAIAGALTNGSVNAASGFAQFSNLIVSEATGSYYMKYSLDSYDSSCVALALTNDATQLVLAAPSPASVYAGSCSSAFTITTKNPAGTTTNVSANRTVTLSTNGTLSFYTNSDCSSATTTTLTIASGANSATFYAKSNTGGQSITVTATAPMAAGTVSDTVNFTVNTAPTLAALSVLSGNNQSGSPSSSLGNPFTVLATGDDGSALSGATITWTVLGGDGTLSAASSTTNGSGHASTTLTLGASSGQNIVVASSGGYSATFYAQAASCPATPTGNSPFESGTGTAADPFIICTTTQFNAIGTNAARLNKYYRLDGNLDFGGAAPTRIGAYSASPFTGEFDGNGFTISNYAITASANNAGLFNYIAYGKIQNLKISGITVTGASTYTNIGGLVGYSDTGLLDNITLSGTNAITGLDSVGGVVGNTWLNTVLTNVKIEAGTTVTGRHYVGGVVGYNSDPNNSSGSPPGQLRNILSAATIVGSGNGLGGVIGWGVRSYITRAGFTGTVTASATSAVELGGIAGRGEQIGESYSTGTISSGGFASVYRCGGIAGLASTIWDSYSRSNVYCNTETGGLVGRGAWSVHRVYAVGIVSATVGSGTMTISGTSAPNINPLLGHWSLSSMTSSFWSSDTAGSTADVTATLLDNGMRPVTSAAIKDPGFLVAHRWNFQTVWRPAPTYTGDPQYNAGFPILQWQNPAENPALSTLFAGGAGTNSSPYLISTAAQLSNIAYAQQIHGGTLGAHFKLTGNINFSGGYAPSIGNSTIPFSGVFDGGGFTISNFKIAVTRTGSGFFGHVSNATIKNLTLSGFEVCGTRVTSGACVTTTSQLTNSLATTYVGGLVGYAIASNFENITTSGTNLVTGSDYTGLIAGQVVNSSMNKIHALGTNSVYGYNYVGGIVGNLNVSSLTYSRSSADVYGYARVGGAVGQHDTSGNITAIATTGSVYFTTSGQSHFGGVIGLGSGTTYSLLSSTGNVAARSGSGATSTGSCGGILGQSGFVADSYSRGNVTCTGSNVGGITGYGNGGARNYATGVISGSTTNMHNLFGNTPITPYPGTSTSSDYNGTFHNYWNTSAVADGGSNQSTAAGSSSVNYTSGFPGVQPSTTTQLQHAGYLASRGFDFATKWRPAPADSGSPFYNGGFPSHQWHDESYALPTVATFLPSGSGVEGDPYQITTTTQLSMLPYVMQLGEGVSRSHFKVMNDLDMTGVIPPVIGYNPYTYAATNYLWDSWYGPAFTGYYAALPFSGVFDGNNKTISNLTYSRFAGSGMGLFGYALRATLKNIRLSGVSMLDPETIHASVSIASVDTKGLLLGAGHEVVLDNIQITGTNAISGRDVVGGLLGWCSYCRADAITVAGTTTVRGRYNVGGASGLSSYSHFERATSSAAPTGWGSNVGGFVGRSQSDYFMYASSTGAVVLETNDNNIGNRYAAGFAGNLSSTVQRSLASSSVTHANNNSTSNNVLCGGFSAENGGTVTNAYASGAINCKTTAGGFSSGGGTFTNVYAVGAISTATNKYGLCNGCTATASFWDATVNSTATSAVGTSRTTTQMQTSSTFSAWDSTGIWTISDGTYPALQGW